MEPEPAPLFPVEPGWAVTLDTLPSAGGALDDARVYIPTQGGVLALHRETGLVAWSAAIETRWPPIVDHDVVILGTADALQGVDATSGEGRWLTRIGALRAPLSGAPGRVIATTEDGEAVAVDSATGAVLWRQALDGVSRHPAAIGQTGTVVFALEDARVVALNGTTGHVAWTRSLAGTLCAPATARERVLVGSTNNTFYALDAVTGSEAWSWRAGGDIIGAASDGDTVYFASLDNILKAVNRSNGNQRWKAVLPTRPAVPPLAFDGIVVSRGVAPSVDAFIGKTGKAQGNFTSTTDLEGAVLVDPVLKPYRVGMVVLTRDGRVTALRPNRMMMREPPTAPMLDLPGRRLPADRLIQLQTP